MALEMQVEETKIQPGKAQKHYENTGEPAFLTDACICVTTIIHTLIYCFNSHPTYHPSSQPQVCQFGT